MMKKSGYTPFKMKGKSPMMKKLIGNQHRLPEELKAKILASPTKMMKKSPAKQEEQNLIQKQRNKINPFSAEYRRMTPKQKKDLRAGGKTKKGKTLRGAGKDPITKENITKSLGNLNKKIQDKAAKVDKFIKGPKGGSKLSVKHEGPGKTTIKRVPKGTTTTTTPTSPKKESKKSTGRIDWDTAPAVGTKARTEWYKKHNLKLDDTTPALMKKSAVKLKKKSPAKMMKKSPSKMAKKSPAKLKKKTKDGLKEAVKGAVKGGLAKGTLKVGKKIDKDTGKSMRGVKKGSLKNVTKDGLTARELRIKRNKEFHPIAVKRGLAPKSPKAGDLSAKGRAELKAYEKFYGNKDNVKKLRKAQEEYFKNKK
jgi:hypothetical protein